MSPDHCFSFLRTGQSVVMTTCAAAALAVGVSFAAVADVEVGDTPEYSFSTLNGDEVNQESNQGKLIIFDFWATWCGPCIASMPHMEEIYDTYRELGVEVYGINLDDDVQAAVDFVAENETPWPVTTVGGWKDIAEDFGVSGIPALFVMSPEGEVVWTGHPMGLTEEVMNELVAEHLDVEPPAAAALAGVMSTESEIDSDDEMAYDGRLIETHEVAIDSDGDLIITMTSNEFDTFLSVRSPDGSIELNDDHDGTNSRVRLRDAEAGTYTIYATGFTAGETGSYELTVEKSAD